MTPDIFDRICERISLGDTLTQICRDKSMPDRRNFHRWLLALPPDESAAARHRYAHARTSCMDAWSDQILQIANDRTGDVITEERDGRTIRRVDHENINRSRLRVDTMKWLMSKLAPSKYGEQLRVDGVVGPSDTLLAMMQEIRGGSARPVQPIGIHPADTPAAAGISAVDTPALPTPSPGLTPAPAGALWVTGQPTPLAGAVDPSPPPLGGTVVADIHPSAGKALPKVKDVSSLHMGGVRPVGGTRGDTL
jgi:hypothetical protein